MAILLIKIEDEHSLAFNEFFDYNGYCYACTRSRTNPDETVIDMTSFYEAAVNTEALLDVPVAFAFVANELATVIGWYQKAEVSAKMHTPSLFLEGNAKAYASDAVWVPEEAQNLTLHWFAGEQMYEVIEEEDARYGVLDRYMKGYSGQNQMMRYHNAGVHTVAKVLRDKKACREACERWASLVVEGECQDIRDLKTLEAYAKRLSAREMKNPDGYYYQALACYHLGFVKEGLKQINKALKLEPEASDLIALKGLLLVSKGHMEDGAAHLHTAYEKSDYDLYLFMEGQAYMMAGKVYKAYDCFAMMEDQSLLEEYGIKPQEMENKWNFIKVRYMKLKDRFLKKR